MLEGDLGLDGVEAVEAGMGECFFAGGSVGELR